MGPGQNPQYTGTPKAGGGCGLLTTAQNEPTTTTTCSDFPLDAMLWIKEVEMVDSLEELKSSRSVCGKNFPNFEMLDTKIASALNKIIQNSQLKKERKVSLEEQKGPERGPGSTRKTDRLHDRRLLSGDWRS